MECNCKLNGVSFTCDMDKPYCGKPKLRYRIELFIFETCFNFIIDTLAICALCTIALGIPYAIYKLLTR